MRALSFIQLLPTTISLPQFLIFVLFAKILLVILTGIIVYKIIKSTTGNKFYSLLAMLSFVAWSNLSLFLSGFLGLTCIYFLFKFYGTKLERYLYASGILTFSLFLIDKDFGTVFLLIPILFFVTVFKSINILNILAFIYGFFWSLTAFLIYLLIFGKFAAVFSNLKGPSLSLPTQTNIVFYYVIPVFLAISSIVVLIARRRYRLSILPFLLLIFYFTKQNISYSLSFSLIGIPLVLILRFNILSTVRFLILMSIFFLIIIGFYMNFPLIISGILK